MMLLNLVCLSLPFAAFSTVLVACFLCRPPTNAVCRRRYTVFRISPIIGTNYLGLGGTDNFQQGAKRAFFFPDKADEYVTQWKRRLMDPSHIKHGAPLPLPCVFRCLRG